MITVMVNRRSEKRINIRLDRLYVLRFFFELRTFIIEPLLLFKKSLLFRLQCLQARQFFIALHGKKRTPRRLKDHKLCLMLCLEPRLVFCLLEGIIYRLEPLVVGDIFDERLDFPQTCFNAFQFLAGTVIGTVNILNLLLKIGVLKQIVFREIVECPCRFLEDSELCFMLVTLAVDKPDPLLNISDERDALRRGLSLASSGRPSGNPLLDAFLGVVLSDSFRPGKPLLTFSTEGDVFASLDFISGFLHEPQKIIVVLRRDDEPVDGLLEFLLPARAAFGFGVLLVAHAFVLRGRNNRETVFLTEPVADLAHIIVNPLIALICVVVHEVNRIENQVVMNMVFVNVSGQHILIFSSEDFICKLLADLVGKLRCDLSDFKGLDHMTGYDPDRIHPFLLGYLPRPFKFPRCGLAGTAVGRDQQLLVCLFGIQNVRDCLAQSSSDCFDFSNCHTASIFSFSSSISS